MEVPFSSRVNSSTSDPLLSPIPLRKRSLVHDHYFILPDGKRKCKHCEAQPPYAPGTSNSTLQRHLTKHLLSERIEPTSMSKLMSAEEKHALDLSFAAWLLSDAQSFSLSGTFSP
jgi:hypothetical protein